MVAVRYVCMGLGEGLLLEGWLEVLDVLGVGVSWYGGELVL